MSVSDAVVQRLLMLCEERGITINKLCLMSGVTQSTVSAIVNRSTKSTSVSTLKKLCDGLGISIRAFFDCPLFDDLEQEIK